MDFKVPEGFEPVFLYPNGVTPKQREGFAALAMGEGHHPIQFYVANQIPALPLLVHGKLWHTGWDIPTRYAIDANKQCWADSAHGGYLGPCSSKDLISEAEAESDKNSIRKILGASIPMPEWAQIALKNGWTPPEGWTWEK